MKNREYIKKKFSSFTEACKWIDQKEPIFFCGVEPTFYTDSDYEKLKITTVSEGWEFWHKAVKNPNYRNRWSNLFNRPWYETDSNIICDIEDNQLSQQKVVELINELTERSIRVSEKISKTLDFLNGIQFSGRRCGSGQCSIHIHADNISTVRKMLNSIGGTSENDN